MELMELCQEAQPESPQLYLIMNIKKIIDISVKECNGKIPVLAGTGSNSTSEAIELSKYAEKAGSDALLVVTPYYNKPTQEGLMNITKKLTTM